MGPKNSGIVGGNPSQHGTEEMENKAGWGSMVNKVDPADGMAEAVRKAVALDYLEGSDGDVAAKTGSFLSANSEYVNLTEPDDMYPKV